MKLKAEHKREAITYDQIKKFAALYQPARISAKDILLYKKDLYIKLLEDEEDDNKKHEIKEKIKEIDALIIQLDDLCKKDSK